MTTSARIGSEVGSEGAYVDTSALVKLVVDEPESAAIDEAFRGVRLTSSAVAVTELLCTVRRHDPELADNAIALLNVVSTVAVEDDLLLLAGFIGAPGLKALDAIHLTSAAVLYPQVSPLITYDRRLAAAAKAFGLPVASPR